MNALRSLARGSYLFFKIPEQDQEQLTYFFLFLFSPSVLGANLEQSKELLACLCAVFPAPGVSRARLDGGDKVFAINRLLGTRPRSLVAGVPFGVPLPRGREKPQ